MTLKITHIHSLMYPSSLLCFIWEEYKTKTKYCYNIKQNVTMKKNQNNNPL